MTDLSKLPAVDPEVPNAARMYARPVALLTVAV
jgi:hypothetical protein